MQIEQTIEFSTWLAGLKDPLGRRAINRRIGRLATLDHFGDVKRFDGIGELRIFVRPGYRVYFTQRGETIVILLCGGDKGSQERDVAKAKEMAAALE